MNGSIASANNARPRCRQLRPQVDSKVANALLGAVTAAALVRAREPRRLHLGEASKADASALTA